jgi:scyllo-inosamine-4-phosphate amidinotransferase 1
MKIVSNNDWDPLKEIIVGRADKARVPTVDLSTMSMSYTNYSMEKIKPLEGEYPQWLIDEANEDAEELCSVLTRAGVTVHRPEIIDHSKTFSTQDWTTTGWYTWCPRDLLLPLNNLMIETPSPCRSRLFETRAYHNIMLSAVQDGTEWIAAPKPRLLDDSYQFSDLSKPSLNNLEPIFDAPNCIRLGRDILFQISNTGNWLGFQWLKNVLEPKGYRLHAAEHIYSFAHFDSTIIPLRPGLVLLNSTRVTPDNCPKLFETWDKIYFKDVNVNAVTQSGPGSISPCSPYIGMNILSIDQNTVVVGKDQTNLIRILEQKGFTVIPTRMRHAQTLSGGYHCATLDIVREGFLEDYF